MSAPRPLPWTAIVASIGEQRFEEIRSDLVARATDELDRDAFLLNGVVAALLRELVPPDAATDALAAYGTLLQMLYLCWARGWPVTAVEAAAVRALPAVAAAPAPAPAVTYVQLPPRLVWAEPEPGAAHEPLDGVFVVRRGAQLRVLAVLGLREDREGFTTMEGEIALPAPALGPRPDGTAPYTSVLPAGERAHLLSVVDTQELARLGLLALPHATA